MGAYTLAMLDLPFAPPASTVVRVALPVPIDSLFHYAVPAELAGAARPGCRVLVSFSGRRLTGLLVEACEDDDESRTGTLASLEKIVDPEPVVSERMIRLLREEADSVLCPVGIALAAATPPGSAPRILRELSLTARGRRALESGAAGSPTREVLEQLRRRPITPAALARRLPRAARLLRGLERDGLVALQTVERGPAARPATRRVVELAPGIDRERARREQLARAPKQAELLLRIADCGEVVTSELAGEFRGSSKLVRALEHKGLVRVSEREAPSAGPGSECPRDPGVELNAEQAAALEPIHQAIREARHERFLLHGVTGSGKTEVYLRAVAEALALGRQALVLVPEITLTHQIVARLRARFGDRLAVLHSGLRPAERLEQWRRLRRGDTPIAVGARSALFAPLERIGLIAIDEEHDDAYKNQEGFRYHARDLAARIAREAGCPLVAGTATPSLESRYASERGEIRRLSLSRRIKGRPLPAVEMVDLARERERSPRGRKLILTAPLRRALSETLSDGGQAILFLNRRGFSTQILCFECGHAERCKNCDVALVFHATEQRLRCHYCDTSLAPPELCTGCGAPDTALMGVGTERVEEEVRSLFPEARLARLDRDSARRRGHTETVLRELRGNRLDILIGTQIVAKGHDLPGVRLVGVIAADLGLHLPDFRAAERTFQLLTQVAGRAGRDAAPGRVIVQTFVPDHYALRPVLDHDYEAFYREELHHRRSLGYPPFGRLAQVMLSGADQEETRAAAEGLASRVGERSSRCGVEVLGPAPAVLARLRGRYRFQLLVKGAERDEVLRVARSLVEQMPRLPRAVQASVDVDPVSML
jgi:primosomal protein N' (replication factor Y)